jgi:hypothetical protein
MSELNQNRAFMDPLKLMPSKQAGAPREELSSEAIAHLTDGLNKLVAGTT